MKIIVSGGGTGGHIYPALSLIDRLSKNDEVLYVGSERGLENKIVNEKNINFKALKIQGFERKLFSTHNLKTVHLFLKSFKQSKKIIKEFKPDVVIGTGGYVSGAVIFAAAKCKVPTLIHEQNSVVGLTNKFLSKYVDKIAISFDEVRSQFPKDKIIFTGNPRAQEVLNEKKQFDLTQWGLKNELNTVLVFGGSQGAPKLNQAMIDSIEQLNKKDYQLVFVTGSKRFEEVSKALSNINVNKNIYITPYISNMTEILPQISLIVARAGATTIAEITALGIPSILIPSPYVTADHQTKNAMSLVNNEAGLIIEEKNLNSLNLVQKIDHVMDDNKIREKMKINSKKLGIPDAADRLFNVVKDLSK
ncbi:undecaprenyldiphospho-muramoylpentapeptide beta-N-acetylglucosaminyltransferase [Lactobacillus sp. S2-2]|uniref:undecaprenyldiphospho-muramoylpentapeptide beta-N-acetylglucosaminyltransferase n=1 Tax=Lactobacillus sp. S2-2 TaxID=2692917 RepID=UPI001F009B30|nr:undecaprenyldiphospho-muramoylpentapeptide beta-N-acetylglucosaminyltransferase [Lactobacillus sp. S2-2]MCF6514855.1 undecaprenyldiphospho-muramoylpentapeptide beta-N-acetylglucosaminyltransferase [Lactobacillus sp. S2-2]